MLYFIDSNLHSYIDIYIHICFTPLIFVNAISNRVLQSFVVHCFVFLHFEYIFFYSISVFYLGQAGKETTEGISIRSPRRIPFIFIFPL